MRLSPFLLSALALLPSLLSCKGRFSLPADARFVTQIALGDGFGCSRMKDGSVRCWGANDAAQLGDGTREARPVSVKVSAVPRAAVTIAAGGKQACAATPEVHCWGATGGGAPTAAAKQIAVGGRTACALTVAGDVVCSGPGGAGSTDGGADAPVLRGATFVAAGGDAACAILRDRTLDCWGDVPGRGALPVTHIDGLADVIDVAVGGTHVCVVRAWGGVACWGRDEEGELGDGAFADRADPVDVVGLAVPARQVAVGRAHTCALLRDGTVHCWGANGSFQLADGTTAHRASPILVNGVFEVEELVASGDATCTRLPDGSERCWGGLSLPKTAGTTLPVPTEVRW